MDKILVNKRQGGVEEFDINKIHKIINWAINGYQGVSLSDIEINCKLNIRDGITSKEIHEVLIESAANLISLDSPNYQYVAARLLNYSLRKDIWGGKNAPRLLDFLESGVKNGVYNPDLLNKYSKDDLNKIGEMINHDRDFMFTYAGIKQLCDKYLIKNRITNEIFETPQFAYILIAMGAFINYEKKNRLVYIKRAYNFFSKFKINLPTPVMAGLRTNLQSYASCCLVGIDDTKESLTASATAISLATASRYGIGINIGKVRAIGAGIRDGEVVHTGLIPFLKIYEASVKAWQQNSIRGGSATCNVMFWHYEIEDVIVLKNNAGTDDNRVRKLDYTIGLSKLFYDRVLKNENITLFSPHEVKGLYEVFGHEGFDKMYEFYENDPTIKMKKVISARSLFSLLVKERSETGRIYILNVDHANSHGCWLDDVKMSNLCVAPETLLLTKDGNIVIGQNEGKEVQVWNGRQWSKTTIAKTGVNQKLIKIILQNGQSLDCTEYHKFYVDLNDWCYGSGVSQKSTIIEVRAKDLKPGQIVHTINSISGESNDKRIYSSLSKVESIIDVGRHDDTYCVSEPLEHKAVFNGILTGNCTEVTHPTVPMQDFNDKDAEIGVCILGAINVLEIKDDDEMEKVCDVLVRFLDEIISLQSYFNKAAENFALKRRSLGIGITNLAALLAKNNLGYSSADAPNFVDELMEKIQYYCLMSGVSLAQEKGVCEKYNRTKYSQGILPIDTYKTKIDEFITRPLSKDWEKLRALIKTHGLRNSSYTCEMPCESSSVIQCSTNGAEPVRSLLVYKTSKKGKLPVLVPGAGKWNYELAFNLKDNIGLLNVNAAIQKYMDMSMSTNTYYNYSHYPDGILPDTKIMKEIMYAYSVGLKGLYYQNSEDGDLDQSVNQEKESCSSGSCTI